MKGRRVEWSALELAWIEARKHLPRRELHRQFCEWWFRYDVTEDQIRALCKRRGWLTGRDGRITPGTVPWNKGREMEWNPNSARTQFKRGQEPHNARGKGVGHERVNVYGYVEICVAETNPYTGFERRYVAKHRWMWEQLHGPLPEGQVLKCLDGNKLNTDPSNWEAIPQALLPRLNGRWNTAFDTAEPELKPALMAIAKLEHAARTARRRQRGDRT